ncbi:hypothetical protein ORF054 [Yersinia phage PYps49T]|nr:hypothetical protein ORF054 [Yersinia phage PYps49T]
MIIIKASLSSHLELIAVVVISRVLIVIQIVKEL